MKVIACLLLLGVLCGVVYCAPIHASCKLTWDVPLSCVNVSVMVLNQMKLWNMSAECGTSEKCFYTIKSTTPTVIQATHTTPVHHYVDDLTFTLTEGTGACSIAGYSTSETWYAVLDKGTNYCNLRNLADGSSLAKNAGFKETVSDDTCTQYSSHDCSKY